MRDCLHFNAMGVATKIFLSGVSAEFGGFRLAAKAELEKKGCHVLNQDTFGTDHGSVREMLRHQIGGCDAVLHIVGFRFGAEPRQRPSDAPRRSYTQLEFDIALERGIPVYCFISSDALVRDTAPFDEQPEDLDAADLQASHRRLLLAGDALRHEFDNQARLCALVGAINLVAALDFHQDVQRVTRYAPPLLVGRESELALLQQAWDATRAQTRPRAQVLGLIAIGGEGKTSLVAHWLAGLANAGWPGCDAAFAWSFYSQGARETSAASGDLFLRQALRFFGDAALADSAQGAHDKGQRLAALVAQRRAILVLDGLEPLQFAPTSPTPGLLKDPGLQALLHGLAASASSALCVLTTRITVADLVAFRAGTAPEHRLDGLSPPAGADLLDRLGVNGTLPEKTQLVTDLKGHALTLNLIGSYLRDAHGGDIRRRDRVSLSEADAEEASGHAFRVMDAYAQWLHADGVKGQTALALLQLLGLFDRPASAAEIAALLAPPAVAGLSDGLVDLPVNRREVALSRLAQSGLLTVHRDAAGDWLSLDAHPLPRDYLAHRLRHDYPGAWREGHRRLFRYLYDSTPDKDDPTLHDLEPLYQAVAHGCRAGLRQEACEKVYRDRILRGTTSDGFYSTTKLGAVGANLAAVACFFDEPWRRVWPGFSEAAQSWLLNEAAFHLRGLGRMGEALEPMNAGLEIDVRQKNWTSAAVAAGNLSELALALGEVTLAVDVAEKAVAYGDCSGNTNQRFSKRTTVAEALHQAGQASRAQARFAEAETMQSERQPDYAQLYSLGGYRYCDLLLALAEVRAWRAMGAGVGSTREVDVTFLATLNDVTLRASNTLRWAIDADLGLLDIGLSHLTLAQCALLKSQFTGESLTAADPPLSQALSYLRRAGAQHLLPRGLLTQAWYLHLSALASAQASGPDSAQSALDEAWTIAERGPMKLFMADIHLHRARLFGPLTTRYPWQSPQADLRAARELIERCGYGRRLQELQDAEAAAACWPA